MAETKTRDGESGRFRKNTKDVGSIYFLHKTTPNTVEGLGDRVLRDF